MGHTGISQGVRPGLCGIWKFELQMVLTGSQEVISTRSTPLHKPAPQMRPITATHLHWGHPMCYWGSGWAHGAVLVCVCSQPCPNWVFCFLTKKINPTVQFFNLPPSLKQPRGLFFFFLLAFLTCIGIQIGESCDTACAGYKI